jgi:hypothetical protein
MDFQSGSHKENGPRDYFLRKSRASEYVKKHLNQRGHVDGTEDDLYGDVIVLRYDAILERLTDLPGCFEREDFEDFITRCWSGKPKPTHEISKPLEVGDINTNPKSSEHEAPSTQVPQPSRPQVRGPGARGSGTM